MYASDHGLEELARRRGEEEVSLAWLAEQLRTYLDLHPGDEDASNDAVYRLLSEKLDKNNNGVIDNEFNFNDTTMFFETQGLIGVQSLWGPAIINIIVWI